MSTNRGISVQKTVPYLTIFTVMCRFTIDAPVPFYFLAEFCGTLQRRGTCAKTLTKKLLEQRHQLAVGHHAAVPREVPRQLDHRNDGTETMESVELVPVDGDRVLEPRQRTNVPRHVVAPALHQHQTVTR